MAFMQEEQPAGAAMDRLKLLGTLFEDSEQAILILHAGKIELCNRAAAALLGRSIAGLTGMPLEDLSPARQPDGALSQEAVRSMLDGAGLAQPHRFEWQFLRAPGAPIDVEIAFSRCSHQADAYLVGLIYDVSGRKSRAAASGNSCHDLETLLAQRTQELEARDKALKREILERQQMEKTFYENREIYMLALSAANLGVYDTMVKDEDLTLKENWLARLGYNPKEANQTNLTWESLIHPDDFERVTSLFSKALDGESRTFNIEYRLRAQNGEWRWIIESSKVIEPSSGGSLPRIVGTHFDITNRKKAEEAEREQRAFAEALSDTAAVLNSSLDINKVLDLILTNVGRVVPHDGSDIWLTDKVQKIAYPAQRKALDGEFLPRSSSELPIQEIDVFNRMALTRKPILLADIQRELNWISIKGRRVNSCIGTPITFGDKLLGFLVLISAQPDYFNAVHIERLQAFANQAAVAIRNAQLYTQAQEAAALEERQRLAREMHDVISQTLFSATIKAEALPYLFDIDDPEVVRQNLLELHRLTRGALAEMRTMLMELRPNTIVNTDMANLLRQLTDGLAGRTTIEVALSTEGHGLLPPEVQTALFRITQEAINNVVKHARAGQVEISFSNQQDHIRLAIQDNGCGFDPANLPSDRMGVRIMRERAEAIGANLSLESHPDQGTQIEVRWDHP